MTIRKPSIWFRALVLGAQGVFYNAFCESSHHNLRAVMLIAVSPSLFIPDVSQNLPPIRSLP